MRIAGGAAALLVAGWLAIGTAPGQDGAAPAQDPDEAHAAVFAQDRFPSATACATCHPTHYRQWSVSQHAYAQLSPIFNAMAGKINQLTAGTNGDFCIRCHTPVGMNLGEAAFMSNIDRHPTSREGVTCIVCHRVNEAYGKISGRIALEEGPLTAPVFGPTGNPTELNRAKAQAGLTSDPDDFGRKVHGDVQKFFRIQTSGFCGSCHDVTLVNGFRLEEAFSEYKGAPANEKGISCQDCHMGLEPGRILTERSDPDFDRKNYAFGPAAKVGAHDTAPRKLTNHMFVGPDYSVIHPALFPFHDGIKEESDKGDITRAGAATIREWMQFDWKAGWGTDAFEASVPDDYIFPERWASVDDRYDARDVIVRNLKLLREMRGQRLTLLRNGYKLGEIVVDRSNERGIRFRVKVRNGTEGHNVPTGFDAERLVWLFVRVYDVDGRLIKQSGDVDPNGDVRDLHSLYVHNRELPLDTELFSLQSKFITRMVRGGDREQVLAVNTSLGPLPYVRPETRSSILQGRPSDARKHKMGIEPLGHRWGSYKVSRSQLTGRPPYRAVVQLKTTMVPVNLVAAVSDVGFDYGMSARDVADTLAFGHVDADGETVIWNPESADPADNKVAGHEVLWERTVVLVEGVYPEPPERREAVKAQAAAAAALR